MIPRLFLYFSYFPFCKSNTHLFLWESLAVTTLANLLFSRIVTEIQFTNHLLIQLCFSFFFLKIFLYCNHFAKTFHSLTNQQPMRVLIIHFCLHILHFTFVARFPTLWFNLGLSRNLQERHALGTAPVGVTCSVFPQHGIYHLSHRPLGYMGTPSPHFDAPHGRMGSRYHCCTRWSTGSILLHPIMPRGMSAICLPHYTV